jgi:16S rRNA (cytosine967-C5)-methyltransferase
VSGSAERAGPAQPTSARAVALGVIGRVTDEGAYSNLSLRSTLDRSALGPRDRRLAAELAYGTIRRLLSLDWVLARHTKRPLERADPRARALLRLGSYQLLFTRIPDHAAISATVDLAGPRERAFVNAVLRAVARDRPGWPEGPGDDDISIRTGVASWGVRELRRLLGPEVERAAVALGERTATAVRTNTCRTSETALVRAFESAGWRVQKGTIHSQSLLVDGGDPAALPGYEEGWFAVQDQASSFVVDALGPRPGDRILDACAGPGGKAGHMACLVGDGGLVVAADVTTSRLRLVRRQADRLSLRVPLVAQDARRPAVRGPFDRILVDAPCSGLGAARRRPELLWRTARSGLSGLARLQVAIVAGVAGLLKPGGVLVYSVCTYPRAETDAACDAILRHLPDLVPHVLEGPDGPAPRIRLWPHRHGTDAMFVAGFTRGPAARADSPGGQGGRA